jgi:hypothetical protein
MVMPRHLVDIGGGSELLDLTSYARQGRGRRDRLTPAQVELVERTVRRAPEVMVKVLNRGGQDLHSVRRHVTYLDRDGELAIETDYGERLVGNEAEADLLEDWDLALDAERRTADLRPRGTRSPPKLVHKLMFSMPAGTPPREVLAAVKNFAREEFGLKHRYGMVLHTDEAHPHVHMIVKAMGEHGRRLNIRRDTLRRWRGEFARHLRAQGVAANATSRAVRGNRRSAKLDGSYRAEKRGESRRIRERTEGVARELANGTFRAEAGKARLLATRKEVERGWWAVSERLLGEGRDELAWKVRRFVENMPEPMTDREQIAAELRTQRRDRSGPEYVLTR